MFDSNMFPFSFYRTPYHCYRQASMLIVSVSINGQCGRPHKALQTITSGVNDKLRCPLIDIIDKLKSYNVTSSLAWYKVSYEDSHLLLGLFFSCIHLY